MNNMRTNFWKYYYSLGSVEQVMVFTIVAILFAVCLFLHWIIYVAYFCFLVWILNDEGVHNV